MWTFGDRIGNYQVVAQLRSGGMATLFLGRRVGAAGFSRAVAIKVIHPHLATDGVFVQMFVEEAKLAARIEHPNVVHVDELGRANGTYFLVMDYVHGATLAQLLRALHLAQRRLSPRLAVAIALALCDGLHAAHEATDDDGESLGVVHRDVSPQNVLLSWKGHVKLIDFGVAKARGRSMQSTAGTIRGKYRYMAPEQARAQALDRRADVYAIGIVLWEMLTGRHCFSAPTDLELLDLVRAPTHRAPSVHAAEVSAALDATVLAALAPSPDDRPATALSLRTRLADALPEALSLGASELEALLSAALPDALVESRTFLRAALPEDASAPRSSRDAGDASSLATGTHAALDALTVVGATSFDDEPDASDHEFHGQVLPPSRATTSETRGARPVVLWAGGAAVLAAALAAGLTSMVTHPRATATAPVRAVQHEIVAPTAPVVEAPRPVAPAPLVIATPPSVPVVAAIAHAHHHAARETHAAPHEATTMRRTVDRSGLAVPIATDIGE